MTVPYLSVVVAARNDDYGGDFLGRMDRFLNALYVIGTDGRVRYKSAPGPFGFSTSELEQALTRTLH